jgi:hypothetical protein
MSEHADGDNAKYGRICVICCQDDMRREVFHTRKRTTQLRRLGTTVELY